jgi:hypothetical protein
VGFVVEHPRNGGWGYPRMLGYVYFARTRNIAAHSTLLSEIL